MKPYSSEAILRDGTSIVIRSLTAADRDHVIAVFRRMSQASVRHRFFTTKIELSESDLGFLANLADGRDVALAAMVRDDGGERALGIGRYVVLDDPASAEVAFEVGDADQGRGIGTLLLEHMATIARGEGVTTFVAEVEADNHAMLDMFARSGFPVRETLDERTFHVEFPTADTDGFVAAAAAREREAAARSLRAFFAPRGVAIVGVSHFSGHTIGRAILDNLIRDGYRGHVYPIHPTASEVAGRPCYPSITAAATAATAAGSAIDLAVIAVPAAAVEGVVAECATAGVRGVVVISAGFAEVGDTLAEQRLRERVRAAGMRMVGPNCMGVLSTDPSIRLDATFSPIYPPAGNVSMITQSGALGLAMLDYANSLHLGIADFVSVGNKADVSVNDLLAYWHEEPRTKVIALYLESFGNPRTFARLAPEVARQRPIVAVKSGRSAAGTRAASSHSAALASLDVGIDALFAQTGVIRTTTLEEMFDVVALLSSQPVPGGRRIGVVTNAGGPGILLADACEANDLTLPALDPATTEALRAFLPHEASVANPVDMIASAPPDHYERAIELVGRDPNIDAVVAIYVPPLVTNPESVAAAIARGAATLPDDKPIATVFLSSKGTPALLSSGRRGAIPSYSFPENVALALGAAARYGAWRKRPIGTRKKLDGDREQAVRALVRAWRTEGPGQRWLTFDQISELLAIAGVPLVEHRTVSDPDAAVAAAGELGFPVVLKAIVPRLVHKTDVGGVVMNLGDAAAVATAAADMRARLPTLEGYLVQRQVPRGVETLVGVTKDPSLGPLLVAGIGGVAVELYKDVSFRVTPVSDREAADMLESLHGKKLFDGFRGAPPADRAALIDIIQRISALVEIMPELVELDMNPVIVRPPGEGAVAVDARVRLKFA
ncbi:MAG TPA: GNAT family N-acetyltransferase [Kofleriaceae bacterium]|nr:GNAT family N-acetyltransferase [Kofleriaceae bacterium]